MAGVELLDILPTFCIGAGERDLNHVPHLGRPPAERLDELAQRQAPGRLGAKSVLMEVLQCARILAAVRRLAAEATPCTEPECGV